MSNSLNTRSGNWYYEFSERDAWTIKDFPKSSKYRQTTFRGDTDKKIISWFEKKFSKVASPEEELDKDAFTTAINNDQVTDLFCSNPFFVLRSTNKTGSEPVK